MTISPGGRPADASPLGHKGPRKLDDYVREVAHALMRKGMSESHAIAVARNSLVRWLAKSKNPAVKAAAAASDVNQHRLDHVHLSNEHRYRHGWIPVDGGDAARKAAGQKKFEAYRALSPAERTAHGVRTQSAAAHQASKDAAAGTGTHARAAAAHDVAARVAVSAGDTINFARVAKTHREAATYHRDMDKAGKVGRMAGPHRPATFDATHPGTRSDLFTLTSSIRGDGLSQLTRQQATEDLANSQGVEANPEYVKHLFDQMAADGVGRVDPHTGALKVAGTVKLRSLNQYSRPDVHLSTPADLLAIDLAFDSSMHPRNPAGASGGGKFTAKTGGSSQQSSQQKQANSHLSAADRASIRQFQKANGLPQTGVLDTATMSKVQSITSGSAKAKAGAAKKAASAKKKKATAAASAAKKAASARKSAAAKQTAAAKRAASARTVAAKKATAAAKKAAQAAKAPAAGRVAKLPLGSRTSATGAHHGSLTVNGETINFAREAGLSVDLAGPPARVRKMLAAKGRAMPGGRYPIRNKAELSKAMRAVGRTPASKRAAVRKFVAKRAKALGAAGALGPQYASLSVEAWGRVVDLAGEHRYRHGWIPVGGALNTRVGHKRHPTSGKPARDGNASRAADRASRKANLSGNPTDHAKAADAHARAAVTAQRAGDAKELTRHQRQGAAHSAKAPSGYHQPSATDPRTGPSDRYRAITANADEASNKAAGLSRSAKTVGDHLAARDAHRAAAAHQWSAGNKAAAARHDTMAGQHDAVVRKSLTGKGNTAAWRSGLAGKSVPSRHAGSARSQLQGGADAASHAHGRMVEVSDSNGNHKIGTIATTVGGRHRFHEGGAGTGVPVSSLRKIHGETPTAKAAQAKRGKK